MYSYFVLQFLDGSSNPKAGCKKDAFHDAFDTIYVPYIHISNRNILCNFFLSCPIMVDFVRPLPPEPAVLRRCALRERWWVGLRVRVR